MESFLWACNLAAVVYLCFWAIKEDNKTAEADEEDKKDTRR
ncbi:hypothetical protein Q4489_00620 [Thalassotalea sp. 1_MG-2023]|nr:hypothetical protein [Thalassotalea sp. 1_MG-2023]MDO6425491.1 hypothetical protein [Thalassotalea sp. 1_MG-2023]